jgi:CRP-like cAMP-binding protein
VSPRQTPRAGNYLLSRIPAREFRSLVARCELVPLTLFDDLQASGAPIRHVLFPTSGFISVLAPADAGRRMEIGLVGDEGVLGASLALGVGAAPACALVQGQGAALRVETQPFREELVASAALRSVLHRYLYVGMCQLAQAAVCTRFHVVEERLAKWLLMTRDRGHSEDFHLTHLFLASMLGVRRAGVTRAAGSLQARGLIEYRRGDISITDRRGLERASCACYATDNLAYAAALGEPGRAAVRSVR